MRDPRLHAGREQEAEPGLGERAGGQRGRDVDLRAERLEHVGRARRRRDRAVAVLRDRQASRRAHERRGRRDIERARAITAGAARVCDERGRARERHRGVAQRRRCARDLLDRLALHPQRHEEAGEQRGLDGPGDDRTEQAVRLRAREVLAVGQAFEERVHHSSSRLASSWSPLGVRMLSGWNCTAYWRAAASLTAIDIPSSAACTVKRFGTSRTQSE